MKPEPYPLLPDLSGLQLDPNDFVFSFSSRAYGVQIYPWDSATETFGKPRPEALLVTEVGELIHHSSGPTWKAADNSFVIGTPLQLVLPDPSSIPWILLSTVSGGTPNGRLSKVERILRLYTKRGRAPLSNPNRLAEVPVFYEAEYLFYERSYPRSASC